jgi:sterol desaturase/sphingolipid hydroxylase (fatty acid hydroxylase superfamily)
MDTNYVTLAVPIFIVSMLLEMLVSHLRKDKLYRLNDSISNLSNGLGQQAIGVISKVVQLYCYTWIYNQTSFFQFNVSNGWHWALALLMADLSYYLFHRASHRTNILVGSHVVHHQSEEYNLSVAMRQSWLTRFYSWLFYLPLAVAGVPTPMFVGVMAAVIIYQFWVHTQYIGKLGPNEKVFVTPSHHRVHHGRNPEYVDKNFGAIFIVWDKMFGSFAEEKAPVVYGIVNPSNTWNPLWANFRYYKKVWSEAKMASHPLDKVKVWFAKPEWRPRNLTPYGDVSPITPKELVKYNKKREGFPIVGILVQFIFTLILFGFTLANKKVMPLEMQAVMSGLIVWSLTNIGGIQEKKSWLTTSQILFCITFLFITFRYIRFWI